MKRRENIEAEESLIVVPADEAPSVEGTVLEPEAALGTSEADGEIDPSGDSAGAVEGVVGVLPPE